MTSSTNNIELQGAFRNCCCCISTSYRTSSYVSAVLGVIILSVCYTHVLWQNQTIRVRPIPCWRPILDTIGHSCTDTNTDTDTGNDVTYSLRQTYVTYIAHNICTFQNITSLTSWTAAYLLLSAALQECISYKETNYRLETIGVHAIVLTVKTGKRTTGIGADAKISIGRYRYPLILAGIGRYPILDTGIGLTLQTMHCGCFDTTRKDSRRTLSRHAHSAQPTCMLILWSSSTHWHDVEICHLSRQDKTSFVTLPTSTDFRL